MKAVEVRRAAVPRGRCYWACGGDAIATAHRSAACCGAGAQPRGKSAAWPAESVAAAMTTLGAKPDVLGVRRVANDIKAGEARRRESRRCGRTASGSGGKLAEEPGTRMMAPANEGEDALARGRSRPATNRGPRNVLARLGAPAFALAAVAAHRHGRGCGWWRWWWWRNRTRSWRGRRLWSRSHRLRSGSHRLRGRAGLGAAELA